MQSTSSHSMWIPDRHMVANFLCDINDRELPLIASAPLYWSGIWKFNLGPAINEVERGTPITLFVHGMGGNPSQFDDIRSELGPNTYAVQLDGVLTNDPEKTLEDYAKVVHAAAQKCFKETERWPENIVTHSMGAPISIIYERDLAPEGSIKKMIHIAGVLHPPPLLRLLPRNKHRDQMLSPEYLKSVREHATTSKTCRHYVIYSTKDLRVPDQCGRLDIDPSRILELTDKGHGTILEGSKTIAKVKEWLTS